MVGRYHDNRHCFFWDIIKHHESWQVIVLGLITFLVMMIIVILLPKVRELLRPPLKIEVTPTSGPNDKLLLTVRNNGGPTKLSVFGEIVGTRNNVNDYVHGEYKCGWDDGSLEQKQLSTGETASIFIATIIEVLKLELSEVKLHQVVSGKSIEWDACRWNQNPDEALPAFDLKIRIVGEGGRQLSTYFYTLKPFRYTGPLEMFRTLRSCTESYSDGNEVTYKESRDGTWLGWCNTFPATAVGETLDEAREKITHLLSKFGGQ